MKKISLNIFTVLLALSCKAQDNPQTDIMAYCNDVITVNGLQVNTVCNKKIPENYTRDEIVNTFEIPLMREINKPVDENTGGGNETYWDFVFEDHLGKISFEVYDKKIPELYITHPGVSFKLGSHTLKVGDTLTELKDALNVKGFNNDEGEELYIYIDFNILSFGIEDGKIKYIGFSGNYFF